MRERRSIIPFLSDGQSISLSFHLLYSLSCSLHLSILFSLSLYPPPPSLALSHGRGGPAGREGALIRPPAWLFPAPRVLDTGAPHSERRGGGREHLPGDDAPDKDTSVQAAQWWPGSFPPACLLWQPHSKLSLQSECILPSTVPTQWLTVVPRVPHIWPENPLSS